VKTQIIQLESHDDIISTRDKMGWGKTRRLLLVWPSRGRILTRKLDLQLLLRQAQASGCQLAMVTRDPNVQYNARQLGIPVFDSNQQAQETRWRNPLRQRPWRMKRDAKKEKTLAGSSESSLNQPVSLRDSRPNTKPPSMHPAARLTIFTIGVIAFLSIAAVLIPSAEIALTPEVKLQEISIIITADAALDRVHISGLVPVHPVNVVVQGQDSIETTGTILIPERAARGEVRFTNLTNQAVNIPNGTIVSTPGSEVRFATDRDGTTPAGLGKSVILPVTAINSGSGSKLAADRITAIEGPLGVSLTVTNPSPTIDGSDISSPSPSQADRLKLTAQLELALQISALDEIQERLGTRDVLLTPIPTQTATIKNEFDPADDQPASLLTLDLQLEFEALVASEQDLKNLATSILDANLVPGFTPIPGTLEIEHLTSPTPDENQNYRWEMVARQEIQAQPNEIQTAQLSLGLPPAQAGERLTDNLLLATPPEISLTPSWWPRLPVIPFRINVNTIYLTP
jgi:hypothetical protein